MDIDPVRYYDLEAFLFQDVHERFHAEGSIGAFDLFSIVVWKANRAKSRVARRLLGHASPGEDLGGVSRRLSHEVAGAESDRERLMLLMTRWGLALPMATAILTVLYPDNFSVYDVRVRTELGLVGTAPAAWTEKLWTDYQSYLSAVRHATPAHLSLRDRDRFLWGQSVAGQLERDIARWSAEGESGSRTA